MNDALPPPLYPRTPRTLDKPLIPGGGMMRRGSLALYGVLTVGLLLVAFYMGWVAHHPPASPYVIAPMTGAAWFGLRLFMQLAPRG